MVQFITSDVMNTEKPRVRAAKACKRCSQRKVKCDAVQNGLPCSRCCMDNSDDCTLVQSRRGTYDRKSVRRQCFRKESGSLLRSDPPVSTNQDNEQDFEATAATPISIQRNFAASFFSQSTPTGHVPTNSSTTTSAPPLEVGTLSQSSEVVASVSSVSRSLSAIFEDFLSWRSQRNVGQCGLILLGEPSPLTFALEEYTQGSNPQLHDASDQIRDSANLEIIRDDIHPLHLDASDIAYLKAKGAFTLPPESLLEDLVSAYLTRFRPLYSVVNKIELEKAHHERKLPWTLLHAVCFIGATFCDSSVIHQSGMKSRFEVRRQYYQKAKVLFDIGYETNNNKIILLQSAIMLSFWGPQTHSYFNPCSWVGYGVTFAISLGIHRSASSSNAPRGDKGLLRRLWWTLVVRDTYCSVLIGRPFRVNLSQCDTGMVRLDDFVNETPEDAFYQTQIAHLSLLLRDIVHCRFGPSDNNLEPEMVHARIEDWHSGLHQPLQIWSNGRVLFTCSIALELLYNYYLLLLYIPNPILDFRPPLLGHTSKGIVEACARAIASQVITIVTKANICELPHEIFPAFFVAGIVFYRQMQQQNELVAQMARAHLDNCRIFLIEVQELWGPGNWAMEIFDFLCATRTDQIQSVASTPQEGRQPAASTAYQGAQNDGNMSDKNRPRGSPHEDASFGLNCEVTNIVLAGGEEDYFLMPNFLPSATDAWSGL